MFQTKLKHIFLQSCLFLDNVENYSKAGEAIDDNIVRRMRITRWTPKAINTHSEYVTLTAFSL